MFDYMELQFGHTTAQQLTGKRSKTELSYRFFLGVRRKHSSCWRRVGCPPNEDISCRHCHFGINGMYKKRNIIAELAEESTCGI